MKIHDLIKALKRSDEYLEAIYTQGSCYKFHLFLKELFPSCIPYFNKEDMHVITWYKGKFYDIKGAVNGQRYHKMTQDEIDEALLWSFKRNYRLGEQRRESLVIG